MGEATNNPCIKGPACQALDNLSANRAGMQQLQAALAGLAATNFVGLENVLATHLLTARQPAYTQAQIDGIRTHLKACWFDPASPNYYFPSVAEVSRTYALGMLKTVELALQGNLPIDSWWALDHTTVDMLNFATPRQVTLVIATPKPVVSSPETRIAANMTQTPTLGFSTRSTQGGVQTEKLHIPGR